MNGSIVIYGGYGKTGSLIARAALERGHQVVITGADRGKLDRASNELAVPAAQASLDAPLALRQVFRGARCVIHAAGPFESTCRPVLDACHAEQVPYVDLNGELDVFRALEERAASEPLSIPVVPGVGFGVVAGESVALHAASLVGNAARIWVGLAPGLGQRSAGALRSTFRTLARGGAVVADGEYAPERVGRRTFRSRLGGRPRTFLSMPMGELWAVRRSTAARNVMAGVALPAAERVMMQSGILGLLTRSEAISNFLAKRLAQDEASGSDRLESLVWARAEDLQGRAAEAILTMGEGYRWSAQAAIRAAELVAADPRPGLWSPGQYFGKEFAPQVASGQVICERV